MLPFHFFKQTTLINQTLISLNSFLIKGKLNTGRITIIYLGLIMLKENKIILHQENLEQDIAPSDQPDR